MAREPIYEVSTERFYNRSKMNLGIFQKNNPNNFLPQSGNSFPSDVTKSAGHFQRRLIDYFDLIPQHQQIRRPPYAMSFYITKEESQFWSNKEEVFSFSFLPKLRTTLGPNTIRSEYLYFFFIFSLAEIESGAFEVNFKKYLSSLYVELLSDPRGTPLVDTTSKKSDLVELVHEWFANMNITVKRFVIINETFFEIIMDEEGNEIEQTNYAIHYELNILFDPGHLINVDMFTSFLDILAQYGFEIGTRYVPTKWSTYCFSLGSQEKRIWSMDPDGSAYNPEPGWTSNQHIQFTRPR